MQSGSGPQFSTLPKAALFVTFGGFGAEWSWVYWIVDWDGLRAAGKCWLFRKEAVVRSVETLCQEDE